MDTAISRYAKAKGISETEAVKQFKELNKRFNSLYGTGGLGLGTFDINNDNQRPAHDAMGAAFKNDPALFEAFNSWRTVNGGGSVKDALLSANNTLGFKDTMRGINDSIMGSETQKEAYSDLFGAYGFTENADGSFSEPFYKEQGKKAADAAIQAAAPPTDAEVKAAEEEAAAAAAAPAAAPKTLDQPEGGAAQAPGGMPMTPEGQAQAAMQAKANSMPNTVDRLGGSGSKMGNLAQGRVQAEADRLADNIIKQNKIDERKKATLDLENDTMSAKDAQYRNLYDNSGGRKAGAWDALDADQQKQMFRNYNLNRSAGASTPETVQEGLMGNAMVAPNPFDKIGTTTLTPFMTEEEQDDIVTQSLGSPKTENLSPFIPGSFPANQPVTAAEKQGVLPPALRQQPEPEAPTSIQRDPSQGLLNLSNPSQVLPPQDFANEIVKSLPNPIPQKANEFDVSKLPVLEEVQTAENEIPDFSNVPSTAPAPAPAPAPALQSGLTRPQGMPPREEFLKPDPPQAKPKGQSPVYGKKPDGTYGITGYRNLADMKTGAYTPTMANNERRASQDQRARSGEMKNPFTYYQPGQGEYQYNRSLGKLNEDFYDARRYMDAEFAKKAARQRELAAMPTPRADAGMDLMNSLPMNQQVGIVNQFRKKRGEKEIFNPYSA